MHPGAWLTWALCGGTAATLTTNPFYLLPLGASAWVVYAAHHRRDHPAGLSFRVFFLFALAALAVRTLLVLLGPVDAGTVLNSFLEGLRLAVMLVIFGAFNAVADPYGVLRLAPRRFYEAALAAALALSLAPRTIAAVTRVRDAQRARGIEVARYRMLPALAVPVLENGMEDALTLAESMDARGHGRGRRSRYRPLPWTRASVLCAVVSLVALTAFASAAVAGDPTLVPSMFPPSWPEARSPLLAAASLLALPALLRASS
ncbi:MAG TPA: hypothetical protein VM573_06385 [Actinomycetota bacterium]|nr:hypothetical protein [Actinomycetota bacterium]